MDEKKELFNNQIEKLINCIMNVEKNLNLYYFNTLTRLFSEYYNEAKSYAKEDNDYNELRNCEIKIYEIYKKTLERNYQDLYSIKQTKYTTFPSSHHIVFTIDKDNNPVKANVVDVKDGYPVFDVECTIEEIQKQMDKASDARWNLRTFIPDKLSIFKQYELAVELKNKEKLGVKKTPAPDYNLSAKTREQSDAKAWENYAIENGMYNNINYDNYLDIIIDELKICIDFFEKGFKIFD